MENKGHTGTQSDMHFFICQGNSHLELNVMQIWKNDSMEI